ncbi:MAG: hypothetical protein U0531_09565 [Dehalococcoidia bacterium]
MGKEQLAALMEILRQQIEADNPLIGTWTVEFNKDRNVFYFGKCEFGGYEERPTVISTAGDVIDRGGPLLG